MVGQLGRGESRCQVVSARADMVVSTQDARSEHSEKPSRNSNSEHVCHIVAGVNEFGGIERHLADLCAGLATKMRVSVIADSSHAALFPARVEFYAVALTGSRFNPILRHRIAKLLDTLSPNFVHVHGRKAAVMVRRVVRRSTIKSVLTLHNNSTVSDLVSSFDAIIGVTEAVSSAVDHSNTYTVWNGRN